MCLWRSQQRPGHPLVLSFHVVQPEVVEPALKHNTVDEIVISTHVGGLDQSQPHSHDNGLHGLYQLRVCRGKANTDRLAHTSVPNKESKEIGKINR